MVQLAKSDTRPVVYDPGWPQETNQLAYEEAKKVEQFAVDWADSVDKKVVAVFAVAAAIVTFVPTIQQPGTALGPLLMWVVAIACFLRAAWFCNRAYAPRPFGVGPDPATIQAKEWLALPVGKYRYRMLEHMGKAVAYNRAQANAKAEYLTRAIGWTAGEVTALALALVLTAVT
jgi:hypothetical protein